MKSVLVIDDEFGVADVLSFALEDAGYRAETASNGREGLRKASECQPDLIVLDFMMPIMDGPATLKALQADDKLRAIPVIMISSIDENGVRAYCSDFAAYLRKPFPISVFIDLVAKLLEIRK